MTPRELTARPDALDRAARPDLKGPVRGRTALSPIAVCFTLLAACDAQSSPDAHSTSSTDVSATDTRAPGDVAGPTPDASSDARPAPVVPPFAAAFVIDFEAAGEARERKESAQAQLQAGFQCGWHATWMERVRVARESGPPAFRSAALGRAFGWAGFFLAAGALGVLFLAWFLPRLRRRPRPSRADTTTARHVPPGPRADSNVARGATPGEGDPLPDGDPAHLSWSAYFKDLGVRALRRVGRALRVEQFDPLLASLRQRAIELCHDAERQLGVALDAADRLARRPSQPGPAAPETPPTSTDPAPGTDVQRTAELSLGLTTWRTDLASLRRRLEGAGALPHELAADRIAPRLEVHLRHARDLRLLLERHLVALTLASPGRLSWHHILPLAERELAERPETPRERALPTKIALAPWVRRLGFLGLGLTALALPMLAGWMAAGAFPLFFALLFALGALGSTIVTRVHLHRAGALPLLPGFADKIARWLTNLLALALLVTIFSSWMSTESGLDLGDPPPVAVPDPRLLEAPLLDPTAPRPTSPPGLPATSP